MACGKPAPGIPSILACLIPNGFVLAAENLTLGNADAINRALSCCLLLFFIPVVLLNSTGSLGVFNLVIPSFAKKYILLLGKRKEASYIYNSLPYVLYSNKKCALISVSRERSNLPDTSPHNDDTISAPLTSWLYSEIGISILVCPSLCQSG